MFVWHISTKRYNCLNPQKAKADMSCGRYKLFSIDANQELRTTDILNFASQQESQCCVPEKLFQLENHTLMNDLHASGDKSEERIGKYQYAVDVMAHR